MASSVANESGIDYSKSPMVFQTPDLKPDVSLRVFDFEFHVHSVLLKLHSAFFRKFLDSPDKTALQSPGNLETPPAVVNFYTDKFKYDWVTEVDGYTTWHLVVRKDQAPLDLFSFKGDRSFEIGIFEKMLCAIYHRPYKIDKGAELTSLTSLADYYCALPIVSRTLDSAFYISPNFDRILLYDPCEVFTAAAKLRNAMLFRDSLIFVTGPWSDPAYKTLSDPKLKKIARRARAEVAAKVGEAEGTITSRRLYEATAVNGGGYIEKAYFWVAVNNAHFAHTDETCLPSIYRDLYAFDLKEENKLINFFVPILRELLENKLVLGERGSKLLSHGILIDYFLCAEIEDEDLPWDVNEIDW
jgi:hypothetical protein